MNAASNVAQSRLLTSQPSAHRLLDALPYIAPDLVAHGQRVRQLSELILRSLPDVEESALRLAGEASVLHDVGKAAISRRILTKPGSLTRTEMNHVRHHAAIGSNAIACVGGSQSLVEAIRYHHEWWDGRGYPAGISGDHIPLVSRVIAIADAYDAITTERPYRAALDPAFALDELQRWAGSQFDPYIVRLCIPALGRDLPYSAPAVSS